MSTCDSWTALRPWAYISNPIHPSSYVINHIMIYHTSIFSSVGHKPPQLASVRSFVDLYFSNTQLCNMDFHVPCHRSFMSWYEHTSWHTLKQFLLSMQHTCYHTCRIIIVKLLWWRWCRLHHSGLCASSDMIQCTSQYWMMLYIKCHNIKSAQYITCYPCYMVQLSSVWLCCPLRAWQGITWFDSVIMKGIKCCIIVSWSQGW